MKNTKEEMKKIYLIACMTQLSNTGVTTYYNLIKENIPGFEFIIITPDDAPWLVKKASRFVAWLIKLKILQGPLRFYIGDLEYRYLVYHAIKGKVDPRESKPIFHTQDPLSSYIAKSLFKDAQIINTCHFNDDPVTEIKAKTHLNEFWTKKFIKLYTKYFAACDYFICVSDYVHYKSSYLRPQSKPVFIIHNAVDFRKIREDACAKNGEKLIISNCGYFEDRKNQILLIELARTLVNEKKVNFEIWLIGNGINYKYYERKINNYNLHHFVKLKGKIPEPWKMISQSHLYIHTALNDNCPYSVIESVAAGTLTIAAQTGGINEILGDKYLYSFENAIDHLKNYIYDHKLTDFKKKGLIQHEELKKFDMPFWKAETLEVYKRLQ